MARNKAPPPQDRPAIDALHGAATGAVGIGLILFVNWWVGLAFFVFAYLTWFEVTPR